MRYSEKDVYIYIRRLHVDIELRLCTILQKKFDASYACIYNQQIKSSVTVTSRMNYLCKQFYYVNNKHSNTKMYITLSI